MVATNAVGDSAASVASNAVTPAPPPDIDVTPSSLAQTLFPDQSVVQTLTISNAGDADLTWSISENPAVDWLSETPTLGTVAPGDSQEVQVTFDSAGLATGDYATTLTIDSNDPDTPVVNVPALLHVAVLTLIEPSLTLCQDPEGGATGVLVDIVRVYDPATDDDVPVLLSGFQAQFTYDGGCINILDVRPLDFDITAVNIDNASGRALFNGVNTTGAPGPAGVGFALVRLVGSALEICTLALEVTALTDVEGGDIFIAPASLAGEFRRGNVRQDFNVTIGDVLFGAQYPAELGDDYFEPVTPGPRRTWGQQETEEK